MKKKKKKKTWLVKYNVKHKKWYIEFVFDFEEYKSFVLVFVFHSILSQSYFIIYLLEFSYKITKILKNRHMNLWLLDFKVKPKK